MAKLSFDAYLGWVNITNPNQIPADARVISANDLLRYEKLGKDTAEKFAELDKTVEGWKSDTIISDLIDADASETRYAVGNMVKTGVAKFQKVIDDVPAKVEAQVTPLVAKAIAADGTVASAAAAAVDSQLQDAGIMRGHEAMPFQVEDIAWRQTTERGDYLPLGYTSDLGLDSWARKIWLRDINHAEEVSAHPFYARAIVTENMDLLLGIRWDGTVEIPGLAGQPSVSPGTGSAPAPVYNNAPYVPGSDVLPAQANPLSWSMFGSSSAGGVAWEMQQAAAARGATFYNGGVGWESSFHIAARLGSVPALLTFPDNTAPASGSAPVTVSNSTYLEQMASFAGHVAAVDGSRIAGTLSVNLSTKGFTFTRAGSGGASPVPANAPFIPDEGTRRRGDTQFLWMGKNNYWQADRVIEETNLSFEYLAPLIKRCLVLGHFVNSGTVAGSNVRTQINQINSAYAARYGAAYVDVNAYLTGSQVWADTGITPTAADLADQALGNKPMSLSSDAGHLNAAGNKAVANLIIKRVESLGWHAPLAKA